MDKYLKVLSTIRDLTPEILAIVEDAKKFFGKSKDKATATINHIADQ